MGVRSILRVLRLGALTLALLVPPGKALSQDLEPRAFSPAPVGLNIVALAYGYSAGSLLFDQSLPIDDATADVNNIAAMYVRSIDFFGASGKATAVIPFFAGDWRGKLDGEPASTSRTAFGDPRLRIAVSFLGAPALTAREFASYRQKTILGAGFDIIVPLGQYDPDKIINLGGNRWSFKASVGGAQAVKRWTFELLTSAWFFTRNPQSLNDTVVEQDPILSLEGHILRTLTPRIWVGLAVGLGAGGQTIVDGIRKDNNQKSSRVGGTVGFNLSRRHGLKLAYVSAVSTRIGADFETFLAAYQYRWGGGI
jgi:hypothetical protein